jgi:DNA-binding transcriptional ArsR family regulator
MPDPMPAPLPLTQAARTFRLLGNRTRLRLLLALRDRGELSARDLAAAAGRARSALSNDLFRLRAAGVVGRRRAGQQTFYHLGSPFVARLLHRVGQG